MTITGKRNPVRRRRRSDQRHLGGSEGDSRKTRSRKSPVTPRYTGRVPLTPGPVPGALHSPFGPCTHGRAACCSWRYRLTGGTPAVEPAATDRPGLDYRTAMPGASCPLRIDGYGLQRAAVGGHAMRPTSLGFGPFSRLPVYLTAQSSGPRPLLGWLSRQGSLPAGSWTRLRTAARRVVAPVPDDAGRVRAPWSRPPVPLVWDRVSAWAAQIFLAISARWSVASGWARSHAWRAAWAVSTSCSARRTLSARS